MKTRFILSLMLLYAAVSCANRQYEYESSCLYADYFDLTDSCLYIISPYDGAVDTIDVSETSDEIICMSSSHVAALVQIGADSLISAVSGLRYITCPSLHERSCPDVGYENALDFETVMKLNPDFVITYSVSGVVPQYVSKLRDLDIPVLILHDHLEHHPLARAEYVRLFGALVGRRSEADSVFASVCARYLSLADSVAASSGGPVKVMVNVPYGDAWYVPGADSYMTRIISDAGGMVLGAVKGASSSVISIEKAYELSQEADIWLNPGGCRTRAELASMHHMFPLFGPLSKNLPIYCNTKKSTPAGGNDFWESGSVRPDLVLEDLVSIFSSNEAEMTYHFPL